MSASLPHRTISQIRTSGLVTGQPPVPSPHSTGSASSSATPLRNLSSTMPSPSTLRAEEDLLIIEIGVRQLRAGFAGDTAPKATILFTPGSQRRVGDWRSWDPSYMDPWRSRGWTEGYELWRLDKSVKDLDLGVAADRIERALRQALTQYLLIDSKPRKMLLVLPTLFPIPCLSAILDTLFVRFQTPTVSLMSNAVMAAVAAGQRSAIVVELGWAETIVTAVYEYREVRTERCKRGGRKLVKKVHKLLARSLGKYNPEARKVRIVSFAECEEVARRVVWCKSARKQTHREAQAQAQSQSLEHNQCLPEEQEAYAPVEGSAAPLPTVTEEEEEPIRKPSVDDDVGAQRDDEPRAPAPTEDNLSTRVLSIPLQSTLPPTRLEIPFTQLSMPVESAFFSHKPAGYYFDDHKLPVPQLIYRMLLRLPLDVRATTMSRLIFIGDCANIIGLRARIFDEVNALIAEHGWDGVHGKMYNFLKARKLAAKNEPTEQHTSEEVVPAAATEGGNMDEAIPENELMHFDDAVHHSYEQELQQQEPQQYIPPALRSPDVSSIDEALARRAANNPSYSSTFTPSSSTSAATAAATITAAANVRGKLRAVDSLGSWVGASLAASLKIVPIASVDRELWLVSGANGASRPADVKISQRQSMGTGSTGVGYVGTTTAGKASTAQTWTLGAWGAIV